MVNPVSDRSRNITYWFFILSLILLCLQLVYGFILGLAHLGYDFLHPVIPFNTARAVHTNLLVFWILSGFMGATYYIIPEEAETDLMNGRLAYLQLITLALIGLVAVTGYHFNYWEGRKFLEMPRPLDWLMVGNILLFLYLILTTLFRGKKQTTTALILVMGLVFTALLYIPGMIWFDNQTVDSFFRWWMVHLWVEGAWELILAAMLAYLLRKLTGVDREQIEKWLYFIVGLTFISGILGTGHHYYYIGTPEYWLVIGGIFSALEPLAFLGMAIFAMVIYHRREEKHPNKIALLWTLGTAVVSFIGAGLLGLAHTIPGVNLYTHGTLVTAMHSHLAFWGAYGMIVLTFISYALPELTGKKPQAMGHYPFWLTNLGMAGMTMAFATAGVAQVYLERIAGIEFGEVQKEIGVHFGVLLLSALLFSVGIAWFILEFSRYGRTGVQSSSKL
jgi:nitric oxide reductase subunit B